MKYQFLFSGKNKKNVINLLSAELNQRVVKVNPSKDIILDKADTQKIGAKETRHSLRKCKY